MKKPRQEPASISQQDEALPIAMPMAFVLFAPPRYTAKTQGLEEQLSGLEHQLALVHSLYPCCGSET